MTTHIPIKVLTRVSKKHEDLINLIIGGFDDSKIRDEFIECRELELLDNRAYKVSWLNKRNYSLDHIFGNISKELDEKFNIPNTVIGNK